jgi:hypothetical protein
LHRFYIRLTVSHAAGKFGNFGDKRIIIRAPIDDNFVIIYPMPPTDILL